MNPTTQVVREAMKSVSKDIRKPKVVRDGIVKPVTYPHPYHNSGRKTGIEVFIERMEEQMPSANAKEKKTLKKEIDKLKIANEENKKNGTLTYGDIEELIKEIAASNRIVEADGLEREYKKGEKEKELQNLEDMQVKLFKKMGIRYVRQHSKTKSFDMKR